MGCVQLFFMNNVAEGVYEITSAFLQWEGGSHLLQMGGECRVMSIWVGVSNYIHLFVKPWIRLLGMVTSQANV